MIYSIFPTKDSTLFEVSESMNTGIDEILFIEKIVSSSLQPGISNTRATIQFDLDGVSQSLAAGTIDSTNGIQFYLNLYTTEATAIPLEYGVMAIPLSESWGMGVGRTTNNPITTEGASWKYRFGEIDATEWLSPGGTTGSSGNVHTQSFNYNLTDIRMSVSQSVADWLSNTTENNGFLLLRSGSEETDANLYGSLKYFSRDTHTIYVPKLEVLWDDSVYNTGSLDELTASNIILYLKDNAGIYRENSRIQIGVVGRETYPVKTYTTSSAQLDIKYLPSSSYYSVKDALTEDVVIPFDDNYTKVSCNSSGNYVNLWLDGLQPERYYRLVFKIEDRIYTGQVEYFDNDHIFKVIR